MKTEQKQLVIFILKILALLAFACLYAMGGSEEFWGGLKWLRRWLAPALLTGAVWGVTRDWRYLLAFPLIAGSLTLPYGSEVLGEKIWLRFLCGLASGFAFNVPNLLKKRWVLSGYGVLICILTSVILGVFNPTPDAMTEQGAIAFIFGFTYMIGIVVQTKKEAV